MRKRSVDVNQELILARVMVWFVLIGAATVAMALAAHLR
jgi:hypothetical protein